MFVLLFRCTNVAKGKPIVRSQASRMRRILPHITTPGSYSYSTHKIQSQFLARSSHLQISPKRAVVDAPSSSNMQWLDVLVCGIQNSFTVAAWSYINSALPLKSALREYPRALTLDELIQEILLLKIKAPYFLQSSFSSFCLHCCLRPPCLSQKSNKYEGIVLRW